MKKSKAEKTAEWLIDEYPPFFPIDKERLIKAIQENIIDGWIPYIKWYNKNNKEKILFKGTAEDFIREFFHSSIDKCYIKAPKIGESLEHYFKMSFEGVR